MTRYKALKEELEKRNENNNITSVTEEFIEEIIRNNQGIPEAYIDFLREIGIFKSVKTHNSFQNFRGLFTLEEILEMKTSEAFKDILFFADDTEGMYGFDKANNWRILETDEYWETLTLIDMDFEEFIQKKIIRFFDFNIYEDVDEEYESKRKLIWIIDSGYLE